MTFIDCCQRPSQATDTQGVSTRNIVVALSILGAAASLTAVGLGKLNGRVGLPLASALGITALAVGLWPAKTSTSPSTPSRDPDPEPGPITSLKIDASLTHEEVVAEIKRHPDLRELDLSDWERCAFGDIEAFFHAEGPLEIIHYPEIRIDKELRGRICNGTTTEADRRFLSRVADYNNDWVKKFGVNQEKLLALLPNLRRVDLRCDRAPKDAVLAAFEALQPRATAFEKIDLSDALSVVRKHILDTDPDNLGQPYTQWLESLEELAVWGWNYANDEQPVDLVPLIQRCPNLRTIDLRFLSKEQWTDTLAEEVKKLPHLERVSLPYDVQEEIVDLIKAGTPLQNHHVIALEYIKDQEVRHAQPEEAIRLLEGLPGLKNLGLSGFNDPSDEQAKKLLQLLDQHPSVQFIYAGAQRVLKEEADGPLVDLAIRGLDVLFLEKSDQPERLARRLQYAPNLTGICYSPGASTEVLDHMARIPQGKELEIELNEKQLTPEMMRSLLSQLMPQQIVFFDSSWDPKTKIHPGCEILDQLRAGGYQLRVCKGEAPPCLPSETSSKQLVDVTWDTLKQDPKLISAGLDEYFFVFVK